MSTELKLKLAQDREYVSPNSRQVLMIIGLESTGAGGRQVRVEHFQGLELVLVVDCSGSMIDTEPGSGAGPNKLDRAIEAAWSIIAQVPPGGVLSVVGFDEKAEVALKRVAGQDLGRFRTPNARAELEQKLRAFGGRTNVLEALRLSQSLIGQEKGMIQRMVLLSDGMANEPMGLGGGQAIVNATVAYAEQLATKGITLYVLGYGRGQDLYPDFLSALARPSGAEWAHVEGSPDEEIKKILGGAQQVYASNVEMAITFPTQMQVGDIYRFEPQIMYMGSAPVTATQRTVRLRAGQLQSGKAYTWMFELTIPPMPAGRVKLADVNLTYHLPGGSQSQDQGSLTVQMTDDVTLASRRDGNFMFFYEQAKLNKLETALSAAQAQRDTAKMLGLLTHMIQRCRELGLDDQASRYQRILDSFQKDQDFARAALAAASTSTSSKSRPSDYIREGGMGAPPPPPPVPHRPQNPRRRR